METTNNDSRGKYWMFFLLSLIALIAFLLFKPEWFWVCLPFVFTYLVLALGVI